MSFFGRKKVTQVSLTFDVIQKCRCVACTVQTTSECAKPKLASRKEMMENPASMLSQIMTPGMMRNLDVVKNMGNPMGMSMDQMKARSDEMMRNTSKEQIEGIYPALSQVMVLSLLEEMELMGYLEIKDGKVFANKKAEAKLNGFKASLSAEERAALKL